jgi:hypothetical protein
MTEHLRLIARQLGHLQRMREYLAYSTRPHYSRINSSPTPLFLELPAPVDNPALMAAQLATRVSRALHGRKVDVVISAPNLMRLPIHDIAFQEGRLL